MRVDFRKSISTWISCRGKSTLRCINSCLIINLTTFILNVSWFNQKTLFKFLSLSSVIWIARSSGRFHRLFGFSNECWLDGSTSQSEYCNEQANQWELNLKTDLDGLHGFHMWLKFYLFLSEFRGQCYLKIPFVRKSTLFQSKCIMHIYK